MRCLTSTRYTNTAMGATSVPCNDSHERFDSGILLTGFDIVLREVNSRSKSVHTAAASWLKERESANPAVALVYRSNGKGAHFSQHRKPRNIECTM